MLYISPIHTSAPDNPVSPTVARIYSTLTSLGIPFERVDTGEAISMADCEDISRALGVPIVKTLLLTNRQGTIHYLYVCRADKPFVTKDFGRALGIPRVSFAPAQSLLDIFGTPIGGTTLLSLVNESASQVHLVMDRDTLESPMFGCSDGSPFGYIKIATHLITSRFLPHTGHTPELI
ncbi:MAG: prolyl-tRNA synthetase associated domain-containing protein [Muribaculaceae bacterium]|nr:prolyl-tRNA synthetase associated domain-containing protein [Muribaculaceae bacterium]